MSACLEIRDLSAVLPNGQRVLRSVSLAVQPGEVRALVGEDERVREAFVQSVQAILTEMEHFAAVRERRCEACGTEAFRLTGNLVGAMYLHDASCDLDPQVHLHVVLANVTWDAERSRWMALSTRR